MTHLRDHSSEKCNHQISLFSLGVVYSWIQILGAC